MKGSILVSSPSLLSDMVFYKSIILIVDDSDNSHTGFILNKPGGLFGKSCIEEDGRRKKELCDKSDGVLKLSLIHI